VRKTAYLIARPLPLKEQERVRITVHPRPGNLADCYGIMGFNGTPEEADYFAMDSELDYPPPAEGPSANKGAS
jgi:hypothetical protein